jgi:uncharacterized protein YbjQ (UPF0145 family)
MATRYNVVFEGKILPDRDLAGVKRELAAVMKMEAETVERLFSGRPVVLRRGVDAAAGEKFQKSFRAAGAICALRPLEEGGGPAGGGSAEPAAGAGVSASRESPRRTSPEAGEILLANIETIPGRTIAAHLGLVSGSTVRAKHIGKDLLAGLRNIVGGELKAYTELLQEARAEATERMVAQARALGADAVVSVRYSTSSVAAGAAELYAYGTAVRLA